MLHRIYSLSSPSSYLGDPKKISEADVLHQVTDHVVRIERSYADYYISTLVCHNQVAGTSYLPSKHLAQLNRLPALPRTQYGLLQA